MDKKLSFYLDNANFKETFKVKKKPIEIRKSQQQDNNLLKIVNGEICIDANDMFVNLNKDVDMEVLEETGIVTSATYLTKKRRNNRWTKQETEYFYEALSLCGLEFTLISDLFLNKDRKACRMKYHAECKNNKNRINVALNKKETFCPHRYEELKIKIKEKR
ncbi:hypothetical protein NCER_102073 [Vairimorpha ceranae BRL01]|uniref:Myb-like domain-containing protein n=2 Tax=Vairimorpha ceranae TaxID=40302 RepID=C4VBC3_VAIC1|nr:transcription initiation factor tfiiib subunit bdp1 [Vairimorpha ceranae]EEQ81479.1 hypothetical protein NCER_102073 [Vairimorpha ceranae BRL01]KKO76401.1 transcription initiation factor tfiiib subunit bdp1 [Vairimorpha ceranae]